MPLDLTQLSKTMAYALRHQPEKFGLNLDDEGWVPVDDLLFAFRKERRDWQDLTEEDLVQVIAQSEKKRYELRDGLIRAYYGHSTPQKVQRVSITPPTILYHGTTPHAARLIKTQGLKPMRRQYIHLSEDQETAREVGLRRAPHPVVLVVRALEAHQQGVAFYLGNEKVWLSDPIPPEFID